MQPQDLTVTRRSLDVEDYIDILRRHKAWIIGPTFAALVASVVVAFLWPDTYLSSGIIRVVPPQVPESYVPSNLNTDLQGRINQISQGILDRNSLIAMVNKFDLYKKERSRLPMDDVVENMRQHDIKIGTIQTFGQLGNRQSVPAFQVGFQYSNRFVAQKVASELITNFLTQSQAATTNMTQSTTVFLQQSREAAKKKLDEVEARLSAFQARNIGHLPEQTGVNYQQLNALQAQMLNLNTSMSRVSQEKLLLENQMRIYREQMLALKDPTPQDQASQKKNEKLAEKDREITYYENALAAARERYSESHPDVQALTTKLAGVKKQRDAIVKEEESKKPDLTPQPVHQPNPEYVKTKNDLNVAIQRMQALIEAKDLEMADYQKQVATLNGQMKSLQERLQGMPVGLREYGELIRDQELAKRDFEDLDKKVNSSDLATKVINRQQGEKLELLEEASTPQTPTEPKRSIIVLAGTGLGLLVGLFLAGARELRNSALKNLKDVRAYTQLPILGSIPLLENDLVVRRRRRLAWLAWSTACLVGMVVMSSSVVYYYATKL